MDRRSNLASCLVHNGTVADPRDMLRALETLETLKYRQIVDGQVMAEGEAALVKLMAESAGSTILVNGCLFLNVMSFRYLTFSTDDDGACTFELASDGMTLVLEPVEDPDAPATERVPVRLLEGTPFDSESFVTLDDEDDEE
jgi:hypothetical protein